MFCRKSTLIVFGVKQTREDFVREYEGTLHIDTATHRSRIAFALDPPYPLEFRIFFVDEVFLRVYQDLKGACRITYCNSNPRTGLSRVLSHADLADLSLAAFTAFETSCAYERAIEFEVKRAHKNVLKGLLAEAFRTSVHGYGACPSVSHRK